MVIGMCILVYSVNPTIFTSVSNKLQIRSVATAEYSTKWTPHDYSKLSVGGAVQDEVCSEFQRLQKIRHLQCHHVTEMGLHVIG